MIQPLVRTMSSLFYGRESRLNQSIHENILSISGLFLIGYGHAICDTETSVKLTTYILCHKPDKINGSRHKTRRDTCTEDSVANCQGER